MIKNLPILLVLAIILFGCPKSKEVKVMGELKKWHKVSLEIPGPEASENDSLNPFLNYRLDVTFTNGDKTYTVPGYFATDGNAAETSASKGNIWKVNFCPDQTGTWEYTVSFLKGENIAISDNLDNAEKLPFNGYSGSFNIKESDKTGSDFRAKGKLQYTGNRYLQFAETGEYFLKAGADSPENFLGYIDFDGTYYGGNNKQRQGESAPNVGLHAYEPHLQDWKEGDPTWKDGKGKGIIGALNYLASKNMNSVYFLTMNILGDGEDTWPYTQRNERYRFDCSKLDQWEIVFSHMDKLGLMLHIVLQETENECLLDAGYLDVQRKLYLRELIARFSHHLGITWNIGEEHGAVNWSPYGQTVEDTKKMASYIKKNDPYSSYIVVHTHANIQEAPKMIAPLLGFEDIDGPSIQVGNPSQAHGQTLKWLQLSADSLHQWVVCLDEIGPHWKGALPDEFDPDHDTIRHEVLWGNLMAGGAGVEWYFGYKYPHTDLNLEDWRSRDILWDQTYYAIDFFQKHVPFWEMTNMEHLVNEGYCLAKPNEVYVIYVPTDKEVNIDLKEADGQYKVEWFNPKTGGDLSSGSVATVEGGKITSLGQPTSISSKDRVCLLKKI